MTNKEFDSLSEKFIQGKCSKEDLMLLQQLSEDNLKFSDESNLENGLNSQEIVWDQLDLGKKSILQVKKYWLVSGLAARSEERRVGKD